MCVFPYFLWISFMPTYVCHFVLCCLYTLIGLYTLKVTAYMILCSLYDFMQVISFYDFMQ